MKIEEYLKNIEDNNVSYWLYVRENLKPNDYVKLNTGEITRSINVSPIRGNKIYYANGDNCWFDILAVRNFSPNKIDLIEVGDYVNGYRIDQINPYYIINKDGTKTKKLELISNGNNLYDNVYVIKEDEIKSILTREMFESMEYKVGD